MSPSRKQSRTWLLTITAVGIFSVCFTDCFALLKPTNQLASNFISHKSRHGNPPWIFPYVSPNHRYIALNSFGKHTYVLIRRLIPKGGKNVYLHETTIFIGVEVPWFSNSDKLIVAHIQNDNSYYSIITPSGQILDQIHIAKKMAESNAVPSLDGRYVAFSAGGIASHVCVWSLQNHTLKYVNIPGGASVDISYLSWIGSRDIMIFTDLWNPRKQKIKKTIFILHIPSFKLQRLSIKIDGEIDSYAEAVAPYANSLGEVTAIVKTETGYQLSLINPNSVKMEYISLPSSKSGWHIRWASQRLLILWQIIPSGKVEAIRFVRRMGIIGKPVLLPSNSLFSNDNYGNIWYVNNYNGKLKYTKF